ncbi:unnamed protein product [Caenorhabditis angaria]|uniref:B30.2/SPRY domain-containing protein n=1 Tax=Caenorhabditis angaria TaxID=860376 RepID=A0A9P1ILC1_9PELO|nr:unnamed protein product [Caenorhabditis angaria]
MTKKSHFFIFSRKTCEASRMSSRSSRRSQGGTAGQLNIATIGLLDKGRLVKELSERGLDTIGNKDALAQRLYDFIVNGGAVENVVKAATSAKKSTPKKKIKVEEPEPEPEETKEPEKEVKVTKTKKAPAKRAVKVKIEVVEPEAEPEPEPETEAEPEPEPEPEIQASKSKRGRPKKVIEIVDDAPDLQLLDKKVEVTEDNVKSITTRSGRRAQVKVETPEPKSSKESSAEPEPEKPAEIVPPAKIIKEEPLEKRKKSVEEEKPKIPIQTPAPAQSGPIKRPRVSSGAGPSTSDLMGEVKRSRFEEKERREKEKIVVKAPSWKEKWAEKMKEAREKTEKEKEKEQKPKIVEKRKESVEKPKESPVEKVDVLSAIISSTTSKPKPPKPEELPKALKIETSSDMRALGGADLLRQTQKASPFGVHLPSPKIVQKSSDIPPPPPPRPKPVIVAPPPPPPPKVLAPVVKTISGVPPPPPPRVKPTVTTVPSPSKIALPPTPAPTTVILQLLHSQPKLATSPLKISGTPPKLDLKSRIAEVFELDLGAGKEPSPEKIASPEAQENSDEEEDFVIRETVVETLPPIATSVKIEARPEKSPEILEDEEEYDPFENTTIQEECVEYYPSFATQNDEEMEDEEGPSTSQQSEYQEEDDESEIIVDDSEYNPEDTTVTESDLSTRDLLKLALPVLQSLTNKLGETDEKEGKNDEEEDQDFCQIIEESVLLEEKENPEDVYYHGDPVPEIDENELFEIAAGIKPAKKKEKKPLVQIPDEERLPAQNLWELDYYNASIHLKSAEDNIWKIEPFQQDGLALMWGSVRSNFGLKIPAKHCRKIGFQIEIESFPSIQHLPTEFMHENGDVRVGFSLGSAPLILGEYSGTWCISSSGKKATNNIFTDISTSFGVNDIITCVLDLDKSTIEYSKNGEEIGVIFVDLAFSDGDLVFPTICVKNAIVNVNFGQESEKDEAKWKIPSDRIWKFPTEIPNLPDVLERTRQAPESKSACTVLMTVGLPGVGKTTWVRRYLSEHPHENWTIISADTVADAMRINGVARNRQTNLKRPDFLRGIIGKSMARLILREKRKLMAFEDFNRKCMIFVPSEDVHLKRLMKQEHEENEKVDTDALMQHKAAISLPNLENDPCESIIFIDPPAPYEHLAYERVAKMNADCKSWLVGQGNQRKRGGFQKNSANLSINTYNNSTFNSSSGPNSDFSPRGFNVTHTTFSSLREKSPPVVIKTDLTKPLFLNMSTPQQQQSTYHQNRRSSDSNGPGPLSSSTTTPNTQQQQQMTPTTASPQLVSTSRFAPPIGTSTPMFPFPCDVNLPPPNFSLPPPSFTQPPPQQLFQQVPPLLQQPPPQMYHHYGAPPPQ